MGFSLSGESKGEGGRTQGEERNIEEGEEEEKEEEGEKKIRCNVSEKKNKRGKYIIYHCIIWTSRQPNQEALSDYFCLIIQSAGNGEGIISQLQIAGLEF